MLQTLVGFGQDLLNFHSLLGTYVHPTLLHQATRFKKSGSSGMIAIFFPRHCSRVVMMLKTKLFSRREYFFGCSCFVEISHLLYRTKISCFWQMAPQKAFWRKLKNVSLSVSLSHTCTYTQSLVIF